MKKLPGSTAVRRDVAGVWSYRLLLVVSVSALALTSLGDDGGATREGRKAFDLSKDLSRENRMFVEGRYYETIKSWDRDQRQPR